MPRKILHLDLDAFFCAVEEQKNPSLVGKPFAVGGKPNERGVVSSCSYAARKFGVRSAMPMARALRLCPQLKVLSPRHGIYSQISRQVMALLLELTPLVEQISIDEAFIDFSGMPESGEMLARRIQETIHNRLGLPVSIGVASNKLVAKIANDAGKAAARGDSPPNAITVVPPGQEAEFLSPLPVLSLWGVGPKTAERLAGLGIHTIGQLARFPEHDLVRLFGKTGSDFIRRAQGIDDDPIATSHELKSISNEVTFARDVRDVKKLHSTLRELSESVGKRLRKEGLSGKTVKIKVRWPDFSTITRQESLQFSTNQDDQIYTVALELFDKVWQQGKAVRLIGVGVSGFESPSRQLSFWETNSPNTVIQSPKLQLVLDDLHARFGEKSIYKGAELEASDGERVFTINELRKYDGEDGPMYVAYHGIVYELTTCPHWRSGIHQQLHFPGQDLTAEFTDAPHGTEVFRHPCVKQVGRLKGD